MFSDPRILIGSIFAGIGGIFLLVGLLIVWQSFNRSQEIDQIAALPLLNVAQLNNTPTGTEAVIEGKIAERNPLYTNGFVAYTNYEYQGERCTEDDDGYQDCEDIWVEQEYLTPILWLDLSDGRARLHDTEYLIEGAPVTWQTTETLLEYKTLKYEGFKIGNPVFAKGTVVKNGDGPAFDAEFIYGANRETYLSDQRNGTSSMFWTGVAFSSLGGLFVVVGGVLLGFGVLGEPII